MIETLINFFKHPGVLLIICYLLSNLLRGKIKKIFLILIPVVIFIVVWNTVRNDVGEFYYVMAFLISLFCGILFACGGKVSDKNSAQLALLYFGAAISIVLTHNLLVIFVLFELMLIAATFMIFNGNNKLSSMAGTAYFKFHILAGALFLMGAITYYKEYGDFEIIRHNFADFSSGKLQVLNFLILSSLLINLAMPPFSYWLVEGYAAATPAGSVFLSVGVTKVALFLLTKLFLGQHYLIYLGIFMGGYGILYAAMESNLRRIVNYGIISQLGVIMIAIGVGGNSGREAAIFMVVSEIIYIALAMMCVASLVWNLGIKRYFQIPNFIRQPYFLIICGLVACATISSLPFTPGYIGKYLLYHSEYIVANPWLKHTLSALTAGITFSVGIKLPMFIFMDRFHNQDAVTSSNSVYEISYMQRVALVVLVAVTILLGVFPEVLLKRVIPLFDGMFFNQISLFLGVLVAFILFGKKLAVKKRYTLLDFDWVYRFLFMNLYEFIRAVIIRRKHCALNNLGVTYQKVSNKMNLFCGERGVLITINSQKNVIFAIICVLIISIVTLL